MVTMVRIMSGAGLLLPGNAMTTSVLGAVMMGVVLFALPLKEGGPLATTSVTPILLKLPSFSAHRPWE